MSKIRTIAMINTFVVYPIFMVVHFRRDIKQFIKMALQECAEEEGYTSYKEMIKAAWNDPFNS